MKYRKTFENPFNVKRQREKKLKISKFDQFKYNKRQTTVRVVNSHCNFQYQQNDYKLDPGVRYISPTLPIQWHITTSAI